MEANSPDLRPRVGGMVLTCLLLVGCNSDEASSSETKGRVAPSGTDRAADSLPPAKSEPKSIRVATWNLEWLSAREGKGAVKRTQAEFDTLAAYANTLSADLIGVQEVEDEAALAKVFNPALYDFHLSSRRDRQRVGFAIRKSLSFRAMPDLSDLNVSSVRRGVDIEVQVGGRRLRVLAVHLKSGCFQAPLNDDKRACSILADQVPIVEGWIEARAREGVPFVVLGDFNRRFDVPDEVMWADISDGDPEGSSLAKITTGRKPGCWGGHYKRYIDNILFGEAAQAWVVEDSFRESLFEESDKGRRKILSDHCALSVVLEPATDAPMSFVAPHKGPKLGLNAYAHKPSSDPPALIPSKRAPPFPKQAAPPGQEGKIKGNVSREGNKIYHRPDCPSYGRTRISTDKGERWFESAEEAEAAGWALAGNCH